MPNWVFNNLTVAGDPELVEEFKVAVSQPYDTFQHESFFDSGSQSWSSKAKPVRVESVFSAWNIVRPEDEILDEYFSVANGEAPANNWYAWNNKNWGTKWGACEEEIVEDEIYSGVRNLTYKYETAWMPFSKEFMITMSQKFPSLKFFLSYEEEQGWGGEETWENGIQTHQDEWDIPTSHAEYEAQGKSHSCVCTWLDTEEWYSDCPKPIDSDESTVVESAQTEGEI